MKIAVALMMLVVAALVPVVADAAEVDNAKAGGFSELQVSGSVIAEGPLSACVTGKPCKLVVDVKNPTQQEMKIDRIDVTCKAEGKDVAIDAKPDANPPISVAAGGSAQVNVSITLPESAGDKQATICCVLGQGETSRRVEVPVYVTPAFEITLLPARLILDTGAGAKTVGMSVINHLDEQFEGKITFKPYQGIEVKPTEVDARIDPLGLEAFVVNISAGGKPAPGHYAVFVDVAGKAKDWVAVEVPVVMKKSVVKIDGRLDEWNGVEPVMLRRFVGEKDGAGDYETIGRAWFAYDQAGMSVALEIEDANHVLSPDSSSRLAGKSDMVRIAIDPLVNGAKTPSGGYKDDDREYAFIGAEGGSVILKTAEGTKTMEQELKSPLAWRRDGNKSVYEASIPWQEMKDFKPEKGKMLAVSVLVNQTDGSAVTQYEFGGGIAGSCDPRKFVPAVLAE